MDERLLDDSQWLSTYGLITVQRIFETLHIVLPPEQLFAVLKKTKSFYHRLLILPLKNITNGIILQQADEYHLYAQKLLIDYLLSQESTKEEASPGNTTRESLEEEREKLTILGDEKIKIQLKHNELIANSQSMLKSFVTSWKRDAEKTVKHLETLLKQQGHELKKEQIKEALQQVAVGYTYDQTSPEKGSNFPLELFCNNLSISLSEENNTEIDTAIGSLFTLPPKFDEEFHALQEEIFTVNEQIKTFRNLFYQSTLRIVELINLLPGYKTDPTQDSDNRELLYFDKTLFEN